MWRVVRSNRCDEFDFSCYRLMKGDVIKFGRVRFKVRDLISPTYKKMERD